MPSGSKGFRDLKVWHKATDLVVDVYRETKPFTTDERFGPTSQLRRAAVSVIANLAEGSGRVTRGEFLNCLSVARGSLTELEALVEVSLRLGLLAPDVASQLATKVDEIGRMVGGWARKGR